jgi:hypothetical protein
VNWKVLVASLLLVGCTNSQDQKTIESLNGQVTQLQEDLKKSTETSAKLPELEKELAELKLENTKLKEENEGLNKDLAQLKNRNVVATRKVPEVGSKASQDRAIKHLKNNSQDRKAVKDQATGASALSE